MIQNTFILIIFIYLIGLSLQFKAIACQSSCTFGSSYVIAGLLTVPLLPNQLCFTTPANANSDVLIDITRNGLEQCAGTTVPQDNPNYCELDGEQECALNCGCNGFYSLCYQHVKLLRRNEDFVCIQNTSSTYRNVDFYPRCSVETNNLCGQNPLCPCIPCTNGEYRLKDENHCGVGYYFCQNNNWEYVPQNDTTVCSGDSNQVLCHNEPYCQVGEYNCYNGPNDLLQCGLPENNTCVKPCVAGKGIWNCTIDDCVEIFDSNIDKNTHACHEGINGPEWVNLLDNNNPCSCPSTDCTTTGESTTTSTTSTTTHTTEPLCPTHMPHPDHCYNHHSPKCPQVPNTDVCPQEFGNFCLTPYTPGVGYVKCRHFVPQYIRIQEFEVCIQKEPTHIVVKEID